MVFNSAMLVRRRALSIIERNTDHLNAAFILAKSLNILGNGHVRNSSTLIPPDATVKVSQDVVEERNRELVKELSKKDQAIQQMQTELENNRTKLLEAYEKQAYNKLLNEMSKINQEMRAVQFELEKERQKNSQDLVELIEKRKSLEKYDPGYNDVMKKYFDKKHRLDLSTLANDFFLVENTFNSFMKCLCSKGYMDGCKYDAAMKKFQEEAEFSWFHCDSHRAILCLLRDASVAFFNDSNNPQAQSIIAHIKSMDMTVKQFINHCIEAYRTSSGYSKIILSDDYITRYTEGPFKYLGYITPWDKSPLKKEKVCVEIVASYFVPDENN